MALCVLGIHRSYGYWTIPYSKDPSVGGAHHFYDEARVLLPPHVVIPFGGKVRLQVDISRGDTASWYVIDLVDLEMVPPPLSQPPGSLSITDFGAKGGGIADNRAAIQAALNAASSKVCSLRCNL